MPPKKKIVIDRKKSKQKGQLSRPTCPKSPCSSKMCHVSDKQTIQNTNYVINELKIRQKSADGEKHEHNTEKIKEPANKRRKYFQRSLEIAESTQSDKNNSEDKKSLTKKKMNKKNSVKILNNLMLQSSKDRNKATKGSTSTSTTLINNLSLKHRNVFENLNLVRTVVNDCMPDKNNQNTIEPSNSAVNRGKTMKDNEPINNDFKRTSFASKFSWLNSVSSSSDSSTTTVLANKFACVTKKIPILKLKRIDDCFDECAKTSLLIRTAGSKAGSKSISEKDSKVNREENINLECDSLTFRSSKTFEKSPAKKQQQNALEKLSILDTFDLDIIKWIDYNTEENNNIEFNEKLIKENIFQEEIKLLDNLKIIELLSKDKNNDSTIVKAHGSDSGSTTTLPLVETTRSHNSNDNHINKANDVTELKSGQKLNEYENNRESENKYRHDDDDDDALSLFAESISGFETNHKSSQNIPVTNAPDVEEYVSQPTIFKLSNLFTYKIPKHKQLSTPVCKVQNDVSTSHQMDLPTDDSEYTPITKLSNSISKNPNQMNLNFKPVELVKSVIFKGVCVFNLLQSCKNSNSCNFPHTIPTATIIENKLQQLTDQDFIKEYMLLRLYSPLKTLYGLCYIDECIRRPLLRILVEMAIDYLMKTTNSTADKLLTTEVVERTLLYLNNVDLNICSDLLNFEIKPGVLLCDMFLEAIGESQNFSRFKTVYINLTMFMCSRNRTFQADVASQILERVYILPYELGLARALIEILKRTDPIVLINPMCEHYEKKLLSTNLELHQVLVSLRKQNLSPDIESWQDDTRNPNNGNTSDNDVRCSPDTTTYDNLNKTQEPITWLEIDNLPPATSTPGPSGVNRMTFNSNHHNPGTKPCMMQRLPKPTFLKYSRGKQRTAGIQHSYTPRSVNKYFRRGQGARHFHNNQTTHNKMQM